MDGGYRRHRRKVAARWLAMMASLSPETLVLAAVLVPFAGAVVIPLFRSRPNLRETITLASAGCLLLVTVGLLGPVLGGGRPEVNVIQVAQGLALAFQVEPLGMLFALV